MSENSLSSYELGIALRAAQALLKVRVMNERAITAIKRTVQHIEDDSAPNDAILQDGITAAVHALKLIGELRYARHEAMVFAVCNAVVYLDGSARPRTKVTISKE